MKINNKTGLKIVLWGFTIWMVILRIRVIGQSSETKTFDVLMMLSPFILLYYAYLCLKGLREDGAIEYVTSEESEK